MRRKTSSASAFRSRPTARRNDDPRQEVAPALNDPNLEQLREEFNYTLNERDSSVFARDRINHDTRYTVWPGQSEDGRKWKVRYGEDEVFPWPGASDARVPLVDLYIKKHDAFLMVLWNKMRTAVQATESNDQAWATRMTSFLRWMKYTQMTEARSETDLLINYLLERGKAVKRIVWCKQSQLAYYELDQETLVSLALQQAGGPEGDERFLDLPAMALDPTMDGESAKLLVELIPDVPSKRLEQALADVRRQRFARFPRPTVIKNRPKITAFAPNEDIFISPDATHELEDANVFAVEVMREAKLRAHARDYGWDPEWTEEVIRTQRGNVEFGGMLFNQRLSRQASYLVPQRGQLDTRKLFLVAHAYRQLTDSEGVPGIYYTVFNPGVMESKKGRPLCGQHELLNYDHGKMPFVLYQTEKRSRKIDDARGYGEVASTWQGQIKTEWDNRVDHSSINTLPPSYYPNGRQPDKWGPGVQIPTNRPDEYGFFEPAGEVGSSKEVEDSVRQFADEYFGFAVDPDNIVDAQNMRQKMADDFMEGEKKSDTQILQLCQQFMPDDFYFRVVGSAKGKPIHATREEIQGQFDLAIGYTVGDMDPEQLKVKFGLFGQLLAMDINGIVDHNEALVMGFEMFDPNAGERLLKPAESASLAEVEDEQTVALKLLVGQSVPVKPGQAYQLRLQTLTEFIQSSDTAKKALLNNQQARDAVVQRAKDLQFQLQQQQNAVIGRGGPAFAPKPGE